MSDYTPTTEKVRMAYGDIYCADLDDPAHEHGCPQDAEFDSWLASVKAEAWDEGYNVGGHAASGDYSGIYGGDGTEPGNPYRTEGESNG